MRIIDISVPVHPGMLTYPGDPKVSLERIDDMDHGDGSNLSVLSMSTHTGTHVDPPVHFVAGGETTDRIGFDVLVGEALVVDMRGVAAIGAAELQAADVPRDVVRVLFLTDRSAAWSEAASLFPDSYTALTADGAAWIVERGIRLVGTDFISIEDGDADGGTFPVHRALLGAGVLIVEGLDLRLAPLGRSTLWCLPLKIRDGDGGPARAILVTD